MALKKRNRLATPLGVMVAALALSGLCGAIEFAEPLEDVWRGARNSAFQRPADGSMVILTLDDKTFDTVGLNYSEANDAKAITNIFAAGANRIYYDRTFSDITNQKSAGELVKTLDRHRGKVFFGMIKTQDPTNPGQETLLQPSAELRDHVEQVTLFGNAKPFGLSAEFPYSVSNGARLIPSMSASIANKHGAPGKEFRPDYTILASTIPSISYIDAVNGQFDPALVANKDILVGPTTARINDIRHIIGQGYVSGVYYHAIAAQTLKEGDPRHISWIYAWILAIALSAITVLTKKRPVRIAAYTAAAIVITTVPFLTDRMFITADFIPAIIMYAIVAYWTQNRLRLTKAKTLNKQSNLPNLQAFLDSADTLTTRPVAALHIRNYERILSAYDTITVQQLLDAIIKPIRLINDDEPIYHDGNTLYWLFPDAPTSEIEEHLAGLDLVLRSIAVSTNRIDIEFSIGIDTAYQDDLKKRINDAKIAAINASELGLTTAKSSKPHQSDEKWALSLMSELDDAVLKNDLTIAYQPQMDLKTGAISSVEALIRWHHPTKGLIPPGKFIPQAEKSGRIYSVTNYVFEAAMRECAPIAAIFPAFELSINLSPPVLLEPGLADKISELSRTTGFPVKNLNFEITETAAIDASTSSEAVMQTLKDLGASLSIDDYGTGHATLDYLKSIPFSELKIDRHFIKGIKDEKKDQLLVRSTITLAHQLGQRVVAEGIEDGRTLDIIRKLKCDRAQGFFIAKPMPIAELCGFLNLQPSKRNQTTSIT